MWSYVEVPPVQCSQPSQKYCKSHMFMTSLFGLTMLWLPEMRMRPLWMIAMRQPQMPQTRLAVTATPQMPFGNNSKGWMGCVF